MYFSKNEYITRIKVTGQKYLHFMEIETNLKHLFNCGCMQLIDHECEFEIQHGFKIFCFAGVLEALQNESRILNFSVMSKELTEDCATYGRAISYKEVVKDYYHRFNVMKKPVIIKKIKMLKLYTGIYLQGKTEEERH